MKSKNRTFPIRLVFPHPLAADFRGLLALGGDLNVQRLILAYRFGIFPWYSEGQPIQWYAPRQRFVIDVGRVHVPKSMRRYLNNKLFTISVDEHFEYIIDQCQQIPRSGQAGTWITPELKNAFIELHEMGLAHSVEVWKGNDIVGGLYGLGLGRIFSGESMFSFVSDSSKFAIIMLDKILNTLGYKFIDCQQETPHIKLMGGYSLPNTVYHEHIRKNLFEKLSYQKWSPELVHRALSS